MPRQRDPARDERVTRAYWEGATLEECAAQAGITRERIRQIVARMDPTGERRRARTQGLEERRAQEGREMARRVAELAQGRPCAVCLEPNVAWARGVIEGRSGHVRSRTCGRECARLWRIVRLHLDPDARRSHRLSMARYEGGAWGENVERAGGADLVPGRYAPLVKGRRVVEGLARVAELRARARREQSRTL